MDRGAAGALVADDFVARKDLARVAQGHAGRGVRDQVVAIKQRVMARIDERFQAHLFEPGQAVSDPQGRDRRQLGQG